MADPDAGHRAASAPAIANPDRLFPADPATRRVARDLFALVESAPILSVHGHVDVDLLADDTPFTDAASLFVTPDHYVTRLLHANGVPLDRLRPGANVTARDIWRELLRRLARVRRYRVRVLDRLRAVPRPRHPGRTVVRTPPTRMFDEIGAVLATPEFRPQGAVRPVRRRGTRDHRRSPRQSRRTRRIAGRADRASGSAGGSSRRSGRTGTSRRRARLVRRRRRAGRAGSGAGPTGTTGTSPRWRTAGRYFIAHGAVSADHGAATPATLDLSRRDARILFDRLRAAPLAERDPADVTAFEQHMLFEMARMSVDGRAGDDDPSGDPPQPPPADAAAVRAGHRARHPGPRPSSPNALQPLLADVRHRSRLPPRAVHHGRDDVLPRDSRRWPGFYPSVYLGAPWWFLDSPDAIRRFREAVTETAGFSRSSGFIDDTRGVLARSRPATTRPAGSRPGVLARLVVEHRISEDAGRRDHRRPDRRRAPPGVQAREPGHVTGRRIVHIGLGNFHRAHQCLVDRRCRGSPRQRKWSVTAFTGRRPDAARVARPRRAAGTRWSSATPAATGTRWSPR